MIKTLIIQGFKTYKNKTIIDGLSGNLNVILGRNGSGKSNLFSAIRFVLSDQYTNLSREERQSLIHEGSGTVMSAYVEIVFDNVSRIFPINKDEVVIRRTIGLKKDDYSIDSRTATKSDVVNLLESAGFSNSNPYYIVPQGKINFLTNCKDDERLALLKDVSGAKVFEVKLKESLKEMQNSEFKNLKIDETLTIIEKRLNDLQIEKDDLRNYQELAKNKKILEYILFDKELTSINNELNNLESAYNEFLELSNNDLNSLEKRELTINELSNLIKNLTNEKSLVQLDLDQTDADYNEIFKRLSDFSLAKSDLNSFITDKNQSFASSNETLTGINERIRENETKVQNLNPKIAQLANEESSIKSELTELRSKQSLLFSKKNYSKFNNKRERDEHLNDEIETLAEQEQEIESKIDRVEQEIATKRELINERQSDIEQLRAINEQESNSSHMKQLNDEIVSLQNDYTDLTDEKKSLWRQEARLIQVVTNVKTDINSLSNKLNSKIDRSTSVGLQSLSKIVANLNLSENVYGPIGELFQVNDKYKTAVEVVAGNSLFHIVVDNDNTASIIMDELNRMDGGRLTFIPLNRIQPKQVTYPENHNESIPLMKKLKFDKAVEPAIRQVFGRTVVVLNLERNKNLTKDYELNIITLDGDQLDSRGIISGGFRDFKNNSRMELLKVISKNKRSLEEKEHELIDINEKVKELDIELTEKDNMITSKKSGFDLLMVKRNINLEKLNNAKNENNNLNNELTKLDSFLQTLRTSINSIGFKKHQFEQELLKEFNAQLSQSELDELNELKSSINENERRLDEVVIELSSYEVELNSLSSELQDKLYIERKTVEKNLNFDISLKQNEITITDNRINNLTQLLERSRLGKEELNTKLSQINASLEEKQALLEKSDEQQLKLVKNLEKFNKKNERLLSKKNNLNIRRQELTRKVRELGVLSEEAFNSDLNDHDSDDLLKSLNKINTELLNFTHINKKAMEQFINFNKQKISLLERKDELITSKRSIEELIENLNEQKNSLILKNFEKISNNFSKIFKQLVPAGKGELIMIRDEDLEASGENINGANIESYRGVSIKVSFNSELNEQLKVEQLSGGQKSLCAITLILAIQKIDPAPFYLFDEIDANLDSQYRSAISRLILELSKQSQFIMTSFRPELLEVADKFYGVMFNNKVSTVSEIDKVEALTFVEGQQVQ